MNITKIAIKFGPVFGLIAASQKLSGHKWENFILE
jgi:hypothetical protein